ncbi:glutathione S-transferase [Fragilariopsis cylindrus CCMP1102]|uniref:Glutathione S-transferase n=1 Tax=Fragilariopsis cylindrus CCMP1102 TaxID=635003 RepID=A0A1E7F6K7_9STRA|nr:glutathione S-transferase [Fragilariopsis cylindrus CCMP1102]|eukprot:OEU13744.1 glutathione S-transferase [Fragilariopsis cylindrus CCMP1102]
MFVKPPRVVPEDPTLIPILYNYDHCPFCVRVRLALGFKNIKHNLVFLANDDVATPTAMVGKKASPIMVQDLYMIESMDIIEYLENDERFGPTNILRPASGRTDLKEWQKSVRMQMRTLQRPRYVATGLIPEFQQLDSRHAFIANHPLPPYDKDEWKSMKDLSEKLTIYADAMANDPTCMIEELNAKLVALDDIVYCDTYCTEGGLSMDDIDLWARLRSISIVQDVEWPDGLRRYMDNLSELGDVPLYDGLAI